jgi:hypothetical protein
VQGVIVPINAAEVMARVLAYAENLAAHGAEAPEGSAQFNEGAYAAAAVYRVAQMLGEVLTAAHLAASPEMERH